MNIQYPDKLHAGTLLLIEDNDADARLVDECMKESKISNRLIRVRSGIEALDFLNARGEFLDAKRPDLILLDLNMPKMDGREFLEKIKDDQQFKTIPVVVLTTSEDQGDIINSYSNHANCFITKPLDFDKFIDVVKSIENFWFRISNLPEK